MDFPLVAYWVREDCLHIVADALWTRAGAALSIQSREECFGGIHQKRSPGGVCEGLDSSDGQLDHVVKELHGTHDVFILPKKRLKSKSWVWEELKSLVTMAEEHALAVSLSQTIWNLGQKNAFSNSHLYHVQFYPRHWEGSSLDSVSLCNIPYSIMQMRSYGGPSCLLFLPFYFKNKRAAVPVLEYRKTCLIMLLEAYCTSLTTHAYKYLLWSKTPWQMGFTSRYFCLGLQPKFI